MGPRRWQPVIGADSYLGWTLTDDGCHSVSGCSPTPEEARTSDQSGSSVGTPQPRVSPRVANDTVSAESGPPGQCRQDSLRAGPAVIYYLRRSKLPKEGHSLGYMAPVYLRYMSWFCVWLGAHMAEGPRHQHLRSVGRTWERKHECVCGVQLGQGPMPPSMVHSRGRCYIPGRG